MSLNKYLDLKAIELLEIPSLENEQMGQVQGENKIISKDKIKVLQKCIIDIVQKILLYFDNAHDGFTDWGEAIKDKFMEIWTKVYVKSFKEGPLKELINAITMKLLDKFIVKWRNENELGSDYLKICEEVFKEILEDNNQKTLIKNYFGDNYPLLYKIFTETFKKIEYNRNLNDLPHNVRTILDLCNNFIYQNENMGLGKNMRLGEFIEEEFKTEVVKNIYKVLILFKKTEDTHIEMYYLKIDQEITVTKKKIENLFSQEENEHFIKREFSFMFLNEYARNAAFLTDNIEIDPNTGNPKLLEEGEKDNLREILSFFDIENIDLDDKESTGSVDIGQNNLPELVRLFIVTININIFNIFNINYGFTTDALGGGGAFIIATLIILYSKNILDIYTAASANDPASSNRRKGNNYLVNQLQKQLFNQKNEPLKNDTQILNKIKMIEELKYIEGRKMFSRYTTNLNNMKQFFETIDENAIEPTQTTFTINGCDIKLESIQIDNSDALKIQGKFGFNFSLELVMIQGEPRYIYRISILQEDDNARLLILGTEVKSRGPSKTYLKQLLNKWKNSSDPPNILDIWADTKVEGAEWILREFSLQENIPTEKDLEKFLGVNSLDDNPEYYIDKTNKQVTKLTIKNDLWRILPGYMKAHGDWGQGDKEIPNVSFDRSFIKNAASFNNSLVYTAGTNSLVSYCSMISISNLKEKNPLDVLVNLLKQCFSSVEDLKNFFRKIQEIIDRLNSENTENNFEFVKLTSTPNANVDPNYATISAVNPAKILDTLSIPTDSLAQQMGSPLPAVGTAFGGTNIDLEENKLKMQYVSSKNNKAQIPPNTDFTGLTEGIMSLFNLSDKDYANINHEGVEVDRLRDLIRRIRQNLETQSLEDSVKFLKEENLTKFLKEKLSLFRKYMTFSKNNITEQLVKYFKEDKDIQKELEKDLKDLGEISNFSFETFKNKVLYSLSLGDLFDLYSQTKSVRYDYLKGILKSHFKFDFHEIINHYIVEIEDEITVKSVGNQTDNFVKDEYEDDEDEDDDEDDDDEDDDEDEDGRKNKKKIDTFMLSKFFEGKDSEKLKQILLDKNIELDLSKDVKIKKTGLDIDLNKKAKIITPFIVKNLTFNKIKKFLEKKESIPGIEIKSKSAILKNEFFKKWLITGRIINLGEDPEKFTYGQIFETLANGIKVFLKIKNIDLLDKWEDKTLDELLILFTSKKKGKRIDGVDENISKLLYPFLGRTGLETSKDLIIDNKEKLQHLVSLSQFLETKKRHIFTVNQNELPLVKLLNIKAELKGNQRIDTLEITGFDKPSYMKPEHQLLYIFYYALFKNNKTQFIKQVVFKSSNLTLEIELKTALRYNLIKNIYKYLSKEKAMKIIIELLKNNILNGLNERIVVNLVKYYKYLNNDIYKLIKNPDKLSYSKVDKKVLKELVKDSTLPERLKMLLIIFLI